MRKRLTTEDFIKKAQIVHNNKYDYSNSQYITARIKINIICPIHGVFYQKPHDHLYGSGCKICVGLENKTNNIFIEDSKKIFGNKFEYNKTNYINSHSYIILTCKKHGDFKLLPNNHLSKKQGCPVCKESKGEQKIRNILERMNINFIQEKRFDNCIGKKRKLPFDFYLPLQNLVIEYDGIHHFKTVNAFGGENGFREIKENDIIKNNFLKDNNINLLRITYHQFGEIENILKDLTS